MYIRGVIAAVVLVEAQSRGGYTISHCSFQMICIRLFLKYLIGNKLWPGTLAWRLRHLYECDESIPLEAVHLPRLYWDFIRLPLKCFRSSILPGKFSSVLGKTKTALKWWPKKGRHLLIPLYSLNNSATLGQKWILTHQFHCGLLEINSNALMDKAETSSCSLHLFCNLFSHPFMCWSSVTKTKTRRCWSFSGRIPKYAFYKCFVHLQWFSRDGNYLTFIVM